MERDQQASPQPRLQRRPGIPTRATQQQPQAEIKRLRQEYDEAKKDKNLERMKEVRAQLLELGYEMKD